MRKTLLLDIDFTLFYNDIPRPHLKDFLLRMKEKYDLCFYTAGTSVRVASACRVLYHDLKMDSDFVSELQWPSLHRDNCPMIELPSGASVKCFIKASEELFVPVENLIMLDDNPSYDNPHAKQIIQAEGFMGEPDDDYLLRVEL